MSASGLPTSAQVALGHLQKEHPYSTYTISNFVNAKGDKVIVLKHKGLAVSRKGYSAIWLRASDKAVMGGDEAFASRGDILVAADGSIPSTPTKRPSSRSNAGSGSFFHLANEVFERVKNQDFDTSDPNFPFIIGGIVLIVVMALKVLAAFRSFLIIVPIYLLFKNTQPSDFDAKKELKRVLRKENLPEGHPEKPKGWLEKMASKAAASLAGEAMTAAGYKISHTQLLNCIKIVEVELDVDGSTLVWVGALNKWYFLRKVEVAN